MPRNPPRAARLGAWFVCGLGVLVVVLRIALFPWAASDPVHSRWLTIEALVEDRTFAVGFRVDEGGAYRDVGRVTTLPTVDVMLDPGAQTFYSSKPPLLQVLYAPIVQGLAWLIGASDLSSSRESLMRLLLLLVHALPFALTLMWLTSWLLSRERASVAVVVIALAGLGTFGTTFSNALSNHVPATLATWLCALAVLRIVSDGERGAVWFALAGLSAGSAAALEYPAAALVVAVTALLAMSDLRRALLLTLPAALLPLALSHALDFIVFGEPLFFVRRENEWFRYAGSYWKAPGTLDQGESSLVAYVFHSLLGHHGVFLLTPFFACALFAAVMSAARASSPRQVLAFGAAVLALALACIGVRHWGGWYLASAAFLLPLTLLPLALFGRGRTAPEEASARLLLCCALPTLTFYLAMTSNYGGITSGPRWLLWLTPLWVLCLPPAIGWFLDDLRRRGLALLVLIGLSLTAVAWPGANPYRHPWSYVLYVHLTGEEGR